MTGGTFTLNNYGSLRVDGSAAIINHPQVAILGLGRIMDRPWIVDGEVTERKITQLSFAFDHRVCDGGVAATFMGVVADAMENPAQAIANLGVGCPARPDGAPSTVSSGLCRTVGATTAQ